jgi:hypothetical protein
LWSAAPASGPFPAEVIHDLRSRQQLHCPSP